MKRLHAARPALPVHFAKSIPRFFLRATRYGRQRRGNETEMRDVIYAVAPRDGIDTRAACTNIYVNKLTN